MKHTTSLVIVAFVVAVIVTVQAYSSPINPEIDDEGQMLLAQAVADRVRRSPQRQGSNSGGVHGIQQGNPYGGRHEGTAGPREGSGGRHQTGRGQAQAHHGFNNNRVNNNNQNQNQNRNGQRG